MHFMAERSLGMTHSIVCEIGIDDLIVHRDKIKREKNVYSVMIKVYSFYYR